MRLVLVVDDDGGSRDALALLLGLEGFTVETASGAAAAIAAARRHRPEAIVCDLALAAGGDGCDVARALRADPAFAATRLVALSGADTSAARERARAAGFDTFLLKPVPPARLVAALAGPARP